MAANTVLTWVNPTEYTDNTVYDAANTNIGYTLEIDNLPAVSIPLKYGTSFDISTLSLWSSLKIGTHNVALAVVTTGGEQSDFTPALSFPVVRIPKAPTNLAIH
jgi:hypothetical protein